MYYGSNSAFLRSVTGRKLTLSSNYVSIRSVYDFNISICPYIPSYYTWYSWLFKGLHGSKHIPPHPEHLCCPTKVSHLHRSHVHCSVHHQSITLIGSIVTYVNKCCKNVPKSSLLHCIATIVINILFSGAIILQNQFNADYGSKIPIWSRLSFIECQQSETNLFWIIR